MGATESVLVDKIETLSAEAKEHKRLARNHRRSSRECMEQIRRLKEQASRMGLSSFIIIAGVEKEE